MPYKDPEVARQKKNEWHRAWRKANPEQSRADLRKWQDRNPDYFMWYSAKRRAKRDGIKFTISRHDIPPIPYLCPIALIQIKKKPHEKDTYGPWDNSPSLDRVNPRGGYTPDNVRVLSHRGNRMKGDLTREDLERILMYMDGEFDG